MNDLAYRLPLDILLQKAEVAFYRFRWKMSVVEKRIAERNKKEAGRRTSLDKQEKKAQKEQQEGLLKPNVEDKEAEKKDDKVEEKEEGKGKEVEATTQEQKPAVKGVLALKELLN
jgi:hypothetical protein